MKLRGIEKVVEPETFVWVGDGFRTTSFVGNAIPRLRMDPFFAIGYNPPMAFEASTLRRGIGAHPHKGFETVTLAYRGKIEHCDSQGRRVVIGEGDVQWMTAGKGIVYEEYHETQWAEKGGILQMVHLWVNLPAAQKEVEPKQQSLRRKAGPLVPTDIQGSKVHVIAGDFQGRQGLAQTHSPMHVYHAYLNPEGHAEMDLPKNDNTALLVLEGAVEVNGRRWIKRDQFVLFENGKGERISLRAHAEKSLVLVISGKPLEESVAHAGACVMNPQETRQQVILENRRRLLGRV